jgi:hypothetical protein
LLRIPAKTYSPNSQIPAQCASLIGTLHFVLYELAK